MKKFFKWTGILLLSVLVIALISAFLIIRNFDNRAAQKHKITPENLIIPTDSLSLERGKELAVICTDCHTSDLGGKLFFTDPQLGSVYTANITNGEGSAIKDYTNSDWILAIRHGVKPDGTPLFIMPAHDYINFSENDLTSLIAYLKTIPPVNREAKPIQLKPLAKIIASLGGFGDVFSVENLDHNQPFKLAPERNSSAVYGEYIVKLSGCKTCHQPNLAGGKSPDPNSPFVPDITASGNLGKWSANDFIQTMKTGLTPEGKQLDKAFMPYAFIGEMNEIDQTAIYNYLKTMQGVKSK